MNIAKPPVIDRPDLTLPPAEAAWLREHYARAGVILEYGSGGSTVLAAELPGKTVFSVESDRVWARKMQDFLDANPPKGAVHIHVAGIGKTRRWGMPEDDSAWRRYKNYPVSVWDRKDFRQPDLVLIDGRFRSACLITTMIKTKAPVTVLFDDYMARKPYHIVERWAERKETRGRMARFEVGPWQIPPDDLADVLALYNRAQ